VVKLTLRMANELGIPTDQQVHIYRGALLHDIGKMGVPDSILLKPGILTPDEWDIMRKHPGYAYDLLRPIKFLEPALNIPYAHHEKWDGTGYPNNLKGNQIPFEARIFALVDVWDALTSDRPYRKAMTYENIVQYILDQRDRHFDPDLAEKFLRMMAHERDL
jgi:putative two-component system response regulator